VSETNGGTAKKKWTELSSTGVWWLITTSMAAALVLGLGTLEAIRLLALPLAMLVFGLTLAAALAPMLSWLERRMPRWAAATLTFVLLILVLGLLIWAIVPSMVNQLQDFGSRLPELINRVREYLDRWDQRLSGAFSADTLFSQLSDLGPALLRVPLTITSGFSGILLILFIAFYILLEGPRMHGFLLSLFPEERRDHINEVIVEMGQAMGGYLRGVALNGVIIGIVTFLGLLILGVDFALIFGVMAGLLELIPVAGPIIAGLIIIGLTLLQSPGKALAVFLFVVVLQQVENNVLVPHIMRKQTEISSLMSILALFAAGVIGGLMGALIAIPIAAALSVLVRRVIAPAIRRQTGASHP
jgi:putative heme transporter